ncbi:MAG: hypothetical protein NWF02_09310 [Candidatus Bathyarchaeota archaeon]|nr:hypothetical protein [Candidatus Bathyarchaeum sp.]
MQITKEQALELAEKYLLYTAKIALRDNISVSENVTEWQIHAKTTPIITGMRTEIMKFSIDKKTGEVGAVITNIFSTPDVPKESG